MSQFSKWFLFYTNGICEYFSCFDDLGHITLKTYLYIKI